MKKFSLYAAAFDRRRNFKNKKQNHYQRKCISFLSLCVLLFAARNDKVLNCLSGTFLPKKSDEIKTNWSEKVFRFCRVKILMNAHENYPFPHSSAQTFCSFSIVSFSSMRKKLAKKQERPELDSTYINLP